MPYEIGGMVVEGMWLILQQNEPDDYVLATGKAHSVREFVEKAFRYVGRTSVWQGRGVEEKGFDKATGKVLVEIDPRYFRPTEVDASLVMRARREPSSVGNTKRVSIHR